MIPENPTPESAPEPPAESAPSTATPPAPPAPAPARAEVDPRDAVLETLFTFHAPTPDQVDHYNLIRGSALVLAKAIHRCVPAGPDRTAAIRKVREAVMTANAGIATHNAAISYR